VAHINEIVFKIRHKKTKKFFKSALINRCHLSKNGRIYTKKPNRQQLDDYLYCEVGDLSNSIMSTPDDWELVEYSLIERRINGSNNI